jgi:protein SCO1/2
MYALISRFNGWVKLCLTTLVFSLPCASVLGASIAGEKYFPNVPLTTQDGKQVRFYDDLVKGKSVAINIIYTSCTDECPLETARMAEVQRLLGGHVGKDVFFYSISIDPEHDTPSVLKNYSEKFDVRPGWLFLTGKKEDIQLLTKKLGLSRSSDLINKDGHASSLMLGSDPTGQWMRNSAVDNPKFLATTMANFYGWKDVVVPTTSYAQAAPVNISKAKFLFESRCSSCHTVGNGDAIGPDLVGVTARRDPAWLRRYLMEPEKVLAEGDPIAKTLFEKYKKVNMPNLNLGTEDVATMVAYLSAQSDAVTAKAVTAKAVTAKAKPQQNAAQPNPEGHHHHH